jgi:hypothetical protein
VANFLFIGNGSIGLNVDQIRLVTRSKEKGELMIYFAPNDYVLLHDERAEAVLSVIQEISSEAVRAASLRQIVMDPPAEQPIPKSS